MPSGLGEGNRGRPLRNFVKELVHKATCGNSPEKTATINGDVFDASSGVYHGAVNYASLGPISPGLGASAFMPPTLDVGVLGVTTCQDVMPATGGANLPGTFRVQDINGIQNGSVIHVVEATGQVDVASDGEIDFSTGGAATGAPGGTLEVVLTNTFTGVVTTSATLGAVGAGTAFALLPDIFGDLINNDPNVGPLITAFGTGPGILQIVAQQPGMLGNMTIVANINPAIGPVTAVPHNLTGAGPQVGTAFVNHVHRSGSITIQNWVTDPNFTFPAGAFVVASASGSPMPALVDNKVSSAAGASAISGQDIAALLNAFMTETLSGGFNAPITNVQAATAPPTDTTVFTVGDVPGLITQLTTNAWVGNTLTFDVGTATADLQGVSRVIVANNGVDQVTVGPPLPAAPVAADTFVITPTQISAFTNQLLSSPGEAGRALDPVTGLPTGAITEGANTGSPANNSNVTPVAALAMMASYKFGESLTGGAGTSVEPNFMLTSKLLSDLTGLGMTLDGFPHYPLIDNEAAGSNTLRIRMPANVGDRAIPRAGTLKVEQDPTTANDPDFAGFTGIDPAPGTAGHAFSRGPADANGAATITLGGPGLGVNVDAGARVYLITPAMNGPKKHGFEGEVKSYDYLSVLAASIQNMLDYQTPSE